MNCWTSSLPIADPTDAPALKVERGEITFDKVSFSYAEALPILHSVSFVAAAGKTTAIVGGSGAGKSTLTALLQRFYDLDGGTIAIDGQDISTVTMASLRKAIAYVSQQPYLFEGTIRDNIRYGRADATDAEIEAAARQAQADDFIRHKSTATTRWWEKTASRCRAGSGSGFLLRAPSCETRQSLCWTKRHPRWTMNPKRACRKRSPGS